MYLLFVFSIGLFIYASLSSTIFIVLTSSCVLVINLFLAKKKMNRTMSVLSLGGIIFTLLFVILAFIPGLAVIPAGIMSSISNGFEMVTGKTFYETTHKSNDILRLLNRDLKTPETIDMSSYESKNHWNKVCFKGPEEMVFMNNDDIVYELTYPQTLADFSRLSGKCFERAKAVFKRESEFGKIYVE